MNYEICGKSSNSTSEADEVYRKLIYLENTDKLLDFKAPFQKEERSGVFYSEMYLLNSNTGGDKIQKNFSQSFCRLTTITQEMLLSEFTVQWEFDYGRDEEMHV